MDISGEQVFEHLQQYSGDDLQSLQQTLEMHRTIFLASPDSIVLTDLEGQVILASPKTYTVFGINQLDSLRGISIFEFVDPAWKLQVQELFRLMPLHQDRKVTQLKALRADGISIDIEVTGDLIREQGKPSGVVLIIRDITKVKITEERLLSQTRLLELLTKISTTYINLPTHMLSDTIQESMSEIGRFVKADRFYIIEYDWDRLSSYNTYEWCAEGILPQIDQLQDISVADMTDWINAHRNGDSLYIHNVQNLPANSAARQILDPQGIRSILAVPIMDGDGCIGFAGFDSVNHYYDYNESDERLLRLFAQMVVNIRQRLANEQSLLASEHKYKALFHDSPDGYLIIEDGVFVECNHASELLIGADKSFIIGKSPVDFSPEYQPGGSKSDELAHVLMDKIMKERVLSFEWEHLRADGSPFIAQVGLTVLNIDNREVIFTTWKDISVRKKQELIIHELNQQLEQKVQERTRQLEDINQLLMHEIDDRKQVELALKTKTEELESFFNVSIELLCIISYEMKFLRVNKAWSDLLGVPMKTLQRRNVSDFVHPDDLQRTKEICSLNQLNTKGSPFVTRLKIHDGSYRFIEWHCVPHGNQMFSAAHDITDKIHIQESLIQGIQHEKELNEMKSRFVSMASHEFRTPLASIQMSAETLQAYWQRLRRDQIESKVKNICDQVAHLESIVSNIMNVSKMQEGKTELNIVRMDIVAFCRQMIDDFNQHAGLTNQIELISYFDTLEMYLDERLIRQVIQNLLSNAVKYSQPNPQVKVRIYRRNGKYLLTVQDNGIGIPDADKKRLFEPFYRARNAFQIEGNGLGLNIVREAIRLQGGEITFQSIVNTGSVFIVTLPVDLDPELST